MVPTSFSVTANFFVPQVEKSQNQLRVNSTLDRRKYRQLIQALQDPRTKTITCEESVPVSHLVELFEKLHALRKRSCFGSKVTSKTVYFELPQLSTFQHRHAFEQKYLESSLGYLPRRAYVVPNSENKVFYSWTLKQSAPFKQGTSDEALPIEVRGRIASFLDFSDTMKQMTLSHECSSDEFILGAFEGKENELATKWAKKLCQDFAKNSNDLFPITLPPVVGAVKDHVRELDLSNQTITPLLLKTIAQLLPQIESLNFDGAKLPADCIEELGNFPNLKTLSLENCNLNDKAVLHLQNSNLEKLDLKNNREITGRFFSCLPSTLKELNCEGCGLHDAAIACLQNKTQLEVLNLSVNEHLTGRKFDLLPPSLKELNCNHCLGLNNMAIGNLSGLTQLEILDISTTGNNIPHAANSTLKNFDLLPSSLKELYCIGCNLSDEEIEGLRNLGQLKILNISENSKLTGANFDTLPPSLQVFYCKGGEFDEDNEIEISALTDQAIEGLRNKVNLTKLDISRNILLTGSTFHALSPSLKELTANFCGLTDSAIDGLNELTQLEILDISENPLITGKNFPLLPTSLKDLDLSTVEIPEEKRNKNLTDEALTGLQHLSQLEILVLDGHSVLTGISFDVLSASLKNLSCEECKSLTDDAIVKLKNKPKLEVLNLAKTKIKGLYFAILSSSITDLNCSNCEQLEDFSIKGLEHKSQLRCLNLSGTNIKGLYFNTLPVTLDELDCANCENLDNSAVQFGLHNTNLKVLHLDGTDVSTHCVRFLPRFLQKFTHKNTRSFKLNWHNEFRQVGLSHLCAE
jgi:Leucine-rich repeat (LRR) protein